MLNEDFKYMVETAIGAPAGAKPLSLEQLAYAERHLPASYVEFLKAFGYGHYFRHGVQLLDPQKLCSILSLIFKADPDFDHNDCHVVSYSAFGMLQLWSERHWLVQINLLQYQVFCSKLFATEFNLPPGVASMPKREVTADTMAVNLLPRDEKKREMWDIDQEPMFMRCLKAHGELEDGECYGFEPSLGLVGYESHFRTVENTKRVEALEHFAIIAQMQPFRLTRMGQGGYEYLREIG